MVPIDYYAKVCIFIDKVIVTYVFRQILFKITSTVVSNF